MFQYFESTCAAVSNVLMSLLTSTSAVMLSETLSFAALMDEVEPCLTLLNVSETSSLLLMSMFQSSEKYYLLMYDFLLDRL